MAGAEMKGAYYNEVDSYNAAWLRNLIAAGHIAPGEVDERSIVDVQPDDLRGFTQCHFFAGIGIWSLAARLAGWPDDRPLWTGSCPCQPFSVAGKQKGFADERHLWPVWQRLIAERRPAAVFGEQVSAASDWLRIVRSDLEALGYAVGCQAIQAASAGADHLRDRYWFVADSQSQRWREGRPEPEVWSGRSAIAGDGSTGVGLADAYDSGSQGRPLSAECAGERPAWQDGLAHTDQPCTSEGWEQRGGEQRGPSGDQEACDSGRNLADAADHQPKKPQGDDGVSQQWAPVGRREFEPSRTRADGGTSIGYNAARDAGCGPSHQNSSDDPFDWVIGADGKSRRVKPGIRLLVNGHSGRVAVVRPSQQAAAAPQETEEHWYSRIGALKAFGNAIDPRPAAQWIGAFLDCERGLT